MPERRGAGRLLVAALLVALTACTSPDRVPPGAAPPTPGETAAAPARAAAEQAAPRDWSRVPWVGGRRRVAPGPAAPLPSVLTSTARARLVYHPTERLDDPEGWAGERLLFLGVDDRWRSLEMDDLGLPDDSWPGADTYGSGALSHDGGLWAAHTHGGVVLVDLTSGAVRYLPFPAGRADVVRVDWVPAQEVLSAYVSSPGSAAPHTFRVDLRGRVRPAPHPGWRTRFDVDGTPVEIVGASRRHLRLTRWVGGERTSTVLTPGVDVPRSLRRYAFGVFAESRVALSVHRGWPDPGPVRVWVLDTSDGEVVARLRVPATSGIAGWVEDRLRLVVANRRVVDWDPRTGRIRQVLGLPGPYPGPGEWAGVSIALRSP